MTRSEVITAQKELKRLTDKLGMTKHEGYTYYQISKASNDAAPDELKLLEIISYLQNKEATKEAEIEKIKNEVLK